MKMFLEAAKHVQETPIIYCLLQKEKKMNIETFRDDFTGMEMHSTVLSSGMKAYFPTLPIAQIAMYNLFTRFGKH